MKETKITLRLPGMLHKQLTKLAAAHRRSLNAEIVVALEEYRKAQVEA